MTWSRIGTCVGRVKVLEPRPRAGGRLRDGSTLPTELSNEGTLASVHRPLGTKPQRGTVRELRLERTTRGAENARFLRSAGGVYIGVGPEQNFTYIAARPEMAFIVDIRRENPICTCFTRRCSNSPVIAWSSCRGCSRASRRRDLSSER